MIIRSYHILIALVIMSGVHIMVLAYFNIALEVQIEQAKGPQISVIGASAFAKFEDDKQSTVEQEEVKTTPQNEAPLKEKKSIPIKQNLQSEPRSLVQKKTKLEKLKQKEKSLQKITKKPKRIKKQKLRSVKKSGKKTVSQRKGGGHRGRQSKVSGKVNLTNYKGRLVAHLARNKYYPQAARQKNIRGRVLIRFSILSSGRVTAVRIIKSSGHKILDQAALRTIKRASPFPRLPKGPKKRITITVPMSYKLQ